jgi:hypothetical protein
MFKKSLAVAALAALAVFSVPAAANAAGYVPQGNIVVEGEPAPGAVIEVIFTEGSFTPSEDVSFTLTGENAVGATLASLRAVVNSQSLVKSSTGTGAVTLAVTLPADATGTYTTTATGLQSGTVGTAAITVAAVDSGAAGSGDSDGGLASTGYNAPMLAIWAGAGALLLGIALVVVLGIVRRQRASV